MDTGVGSPLRDLARPEGLAPLREFIEGFWDAKLERLRKAAEAEERSRRGTRH